jgi:hypothetical protein
MVPAERDVVPENRLLLAVRVVVPEPKLVMVPLPEVRLEMELETVRAPLWLKIRFPVPAPKVIEPLPSAKEPTPLLSPIVTVPLDVALEAMRRPEADAVLPEAKVKDPEPDPPIVKRPLFSQVAPLETETTAVALLDAPTTEALLCMVPPVIRTEPEGRAEARLRVPEPDLLNPPLPESVALIVELELPVTVTPDEAVSVPFPIDPEVSVAEPTLWLKLPRFKAPPATFSAPFVDPRAKIFEAISVPLFTVVPPV